MCTVFERTAVGFFFLKRTLGVPCCRSSRDHARTQGPQHLGCGARTYVACVPCMSVCMRPRLSSNCRGIGVRIHDMNGGNAHPQVGAPGTGGWPTTLHSRPPRGRPISTRLAVRSCDGTAVLYPWSGRPGPQELYSTSPRALSCTYCMYSACIRPLPTGATNPGHCFLARTEGGARRPHPHWAKRSPLQRRGSHRRRRGGGRKSPRQFRLSRPRPGGRWRMDAERRPCFDAPPAWDPCRRGSGGGHAVCL